MTGVNVVDHRPPGPLAGALLGIVAGLLLGSIWAYGDPEVAAAVTAVFLGLVAVLVANGSWRMFGVGMVTLAVVAGAGLLVLVWSGSFGS